MVVIRFIGKKMRRKSMCVDTHPCLQIGFQNLFLSRKETMFSAIKSKLFSPSTVHSEDPEYYEDDSQDFEEEDDNQTEESDVDMTTSTEYILGEMKHETRVFNGIVHRKYTTKASRFIPNVTGWAYNRNIDMDHVKNIREDLLKMSFPHLIGSFKIVKTMDDTQSPKLLDGHHRKAALDLILHENDQFDMDIDVDVYYVSDVDQCDREIRELFIKANSNRNVDAKDIPDILVMLVVEKMIQKWPKNIKVDETKGANRPNITKRDLVQHLKPILTNERFSTDDAEMIFQKIVDINNRIRLSPFKALFGKTNPAEKKVRCLNKASETNFFLNMDCKMSIDVWVKELMA
jgi:hypothetical protein